MIFILTEQVMNGTVTTSTIVTGIEADSFAQAVDILKQQPGMVNITVTKETEQEFSYHMKSDLQMRYNLYVTGNMNYKPLTFLQTIK